ncbi:hypothetical protein SEA_MOLIVIA_81 [Arthrobacter phage Molivia]|jgi:hypothetical protein|uniref:Uncharacterized protein n=1 Tax=Arthrobacter phage Molivia TaxID=2015839 RepID=A0A286S2D7_9CAUD|nr:hypothetical protein FDI28_gp35 [Arthrobacter phage Molivia]ASX99302.1 hypothetical protein SEA_MOLIVIA_81 [Arthrobacter phage Molivia]
MTKETRTDVSEQINSVHELKSGDKVVVIYTKGLQVETKLAYTFGYVDRAANMIKTQDHEDVMEASMFKKLVSGYDAMTTHVWRKPPTFPTLAGSIIHVESTKVDGAPIGRYRRNRSGAWVSLDSREVALWANQIDTWYNVTINIIEPN